MRILCVIPAITIETLDKKININGRCHWYLWWNDADAGKCGVAWRFSVGDMAFLWLAPTQHCQNSVFILRMFLQCFEGDVFLRLPAHFQIIFAENVLVLHFIDKHSTSCTPYVCELNIKLWKPLKRITSTSSLNLFMWEVGGRLHYFHVWPHCGSPLIQEDKSHPLAWVLSPYHHYSK